MEFVFFRQHLFLRFNKNGRGFNHLGGLTGRVNALAPWTLCRNQPVR